MGKKGNGITQQTTQPEQSGEAPPEQHGDAAQESAVEAAVGAIAAPEAAQDEPGPEDFDRHTSARLIEDHARDLILFDDVSRRLKNRGPVIAQRALDAAAKRGEKHPIVRIGDRAFIPRGRSAKAGGGVGLVEERIARSEVSFE